VPTQLADVRLKSRTQATNLEKSRIFRGRPSRARHTDTRERSSWRQEVARRGWNPIDQPAWLDEKAYLGEIRPGQKNSKRRLRARRLIARIHARTANQRSDFLHKMTTGLVRNYQAICIDDLGVKGLARTRLAKSVLDARLRRV
jgi:hypothetical protein